MARVAELESKKIIGASILLAALGYFVDIYDLILFSVVRIQSLKALGIPESELLEKGVFLINMQMGGMLVGGIIWGILGDKRGRLSVLLGSIFLYSLANIANAFVQDITFYAIIRFLAGVGLAGELGAGITLVCEVMPKASRGYGTMIVATIGILGAVVAVLVGGLFDWRIAYVVGGCMGLGLLALRIKASESGMFSKLKAETVDRGNLMILFRSPANALRYLNCILIGVPIWYVVGILITFSPELGKALGIDPAPNAGKAVMFCYIGLAIGDFASGTLSQLLKSRLKVALGFIALNGLLIATYLFWRGMSLSQFYVVCLALGFASGYWAVFVTIAAEQFGTNIRSTVTTTAPNFVRGAVVPLTLIFNALKAEKGIVQSALWVGGGCTLIALLSLFGLHESHAKDLDYCE